MPMRHLFSQLRHISMPRYLHLGYVVIGVSIAGLVGAIPLLFNPSYIENPSLASGEPTITIEPTAQPTSTPIPTDAPEESIKVLGAQTNPVVEIPVEIEPTINPTPTTTPTPPHKIKRHRKKLTPIPTIIKPSWIPLPTIHLTWIPLPTDIPPYPCNCGCPPCRFDQEVNMPCNCLMQEQKGTLIACPLIECLDR